MTVGELRKLLEDYDDEATVLLTIDTEKETTIPYNAVSSDLESVEADGPAHHGANPMGTVVLFGFVETEEG